MPGAHFSVQNHIGSRLGLSAVWGISHADLLLFTVKIYCQIFVPFFQNDSFKWGLKLKRKGYFNFFPFLFFICTLLNVQKIIG